VAANSSWREAEDVTTDAAAADPWARFARELGMSLRRARDARGLTQEKVAESAGISVYAYQQYERGAVTKDGEPTNPRLATILAVCQVLGVSIGELLPPVPPLVPRG
jgi:transcriptional regulator with XRE-family HTH domain